jgi:hypothetical protein
MVLLNCGTGLASTMLSTNWVTSAQLLLDWHDWHAQNMGMGSELLAVVGSTSYQQRKFIDRMECGPVEDTLSLDARTYRSEEQNGSKDVDLSVPIIHLRRTYASTLDSIDAMQIYPYLSCLRIFAFKCFTCGFRLMKMKNLQKR